MENSIQLPEIWLGWAMGYFYFKALHIIFVVTWFAGLFYIPRLFIYHTEAQTKPELEKKILSEQFTIMERRLWYGITWPSAILTGIFGLSMIHSFFPLTDHPWLMVKLSLVVLLYVYHWYCGKLLNQIKAGHFRWSSNQLRIWNEVSTLFLIGIVFLVVLKNIIDMTYGLIGLVLISGLLMMGIKTYRKIRETR